MSTGMLDVFIGKGGPGWCFVLFAALALLTIITIPPLYLLERRGMLWRHKISRTATNDLVYGLGEEKIENSQLEPRDFSPKQPSTWS